ncbi:MAG: tetratricopeptide repeat protein, partial [Bacteroidales bacterium]|nr:tetratricopeptide repeat protein [Bacteroidales bacterium]
KENKKTITYAAAAVVVVALAIFLYVKFGYAPKVAEALETAYPAEAQFQAGNFETALNGDGSSVIGFADIIDEYGTKAGKAVYFYAGVCEYQLGNFEDAITYLKKYNGKDAILAGRALACTGDAYVSLEDYETALGYYVKAAKKSNNSFSAAYLLKAGEVCEALGRNDEALSYYKEIKNEYAGSYEAYEIDKYISRMEVK